MQRSRQECRGVDKACRGVDKETEKGRIVQKRKARRKSGQGPKLWVEETKELDVFETEIS